MHRLLARPAGTCRRRVAGCLLAAACSAHVHAQSCALPGSDGDADIAGTVNTYWSPATGSYGPAANAIPLGGQRGATATLQEGDLVLVMQMQCASLNSSDSLQYGDGAAGEPASGYADPASGCLAGQYQFVRAGAGSSNGLLSLAGSPLQHAYQQQPATPNGGRRTVQVVRVPQYRNAQLVGTLVPLPWDGNTGGIVVMDVAGSLALNGQAIVADGAGFRGGAGRSRSAVDAVERFRWDMDDRHGVKGEGIAGTPRFVSDKRDAGSGSAPITDLGAGWGGYPTGTASTGDYARGAPGTAGGGGAFWNAASDNGGGGGGGNGGAGGRGGAGWRSTGYAGITADYANLPDRKWGYGGGRFTGAGVPRLVLGGGGGAGDNNANSTPGQSSGAAGGGIVMVRAGSITGNGTVTARGARAADNPANDGAGGGGGGGGVLVIATTWTASLAVDVQGGRGGDAWLNGSSAHGPGGGGGGGVVYTSALAATTLLGGAPGRTNTVQTQPGGPEHGARTGDNGIAQVVSPASDTPGSHVGRTCQSDLSIVKTNTPGTNGDIDQPADTVVSGASVPYTIRVSNNGPMQAVGAVVRDTPDATGLDCPASHPVTCSGSGCPVTPNPITVADLAAGLVLGALPVGQSITLTMTCTVR